MSILVVKGKIYHCTKCNESFQVDYQGEPEWTQVGEGGVFYFRRLEEKYKSNAGKDLYNDPVYLHEEAVCEKCVDKSKVLSKDTLSKISALDNIIVDSRRIYEAILDIILSCINSGDIKWVLSINREAYEGTINSNLFLKPHRKGEFVNRYLLKKKEDLIDNYLLAVRDQLVESVFNTFPEVDEFLGKSIDEIELKFGGIYTKVRAIVPESNDGSYYVARDITMLENLNDYLVNENTLRIPSKDTPKITYYYSYDIDLESLEEWLTGLKAMRERQRYKQGIIDAIHVTLNKKLREELLV